MSNLRQISKILTARLTLKLVLNFVNPNKAYLRCAALLQNVSYFLRHTIQNSRPAKIEIDA